MLKSINITGVFVLDQDRALDFYVGKLGLELRQDMNLGFMRWLTVGAKGDEDRSILLELPAPPAHDPATAEQVLELVSKGATRFEAGFTTDHCRGTDQRLQPRDV